MNQNFSNPNNFRSKSSNQNIFHSNPAQFFFVFDQHYHSLKSCKPKYFPFRTCYFFVIRLVYVFCLKSWKLEFFQSKYFPLKSYQYIFSLKTWIGSNFFTQNISRSVVFCLCARNLSIPKIARSLFSIRFSQPNYFTIEFCQSKSYPNFCFRFPLGIGFARILSPKNFRSKFVFTRILPVKILFAQILLSKIFVARILGFHSNFSQLNFFCSNSA